MSKTEPEPSWKQLKLSFERPYKDDAGNSIPILYDLTPEGQRIYEPQETSSTRLEANLRRIFLERGSDFFERKDNPLSESSDHMAGTFERGVSATHGDSGIAEPIPKAMTMEELYTMKSEILPQLFVALGEMSHARDLLSSVLPGSHNPQLQGESSSLLSATLVTKPPPIVSVQAFNAQLTIGSKDEALRKAAGLFKSAAESMERSRLKGEKYWVDALRIRRANWGLTPAPLPLGSATGKGADKTSKDFIISFGLEGSPSLFRRRAVAHLATFGDSSRDIVFPFHQNTRLRITILTTSESSTELYVFDSPRSDDSVKSLENALKIAQTEVVDQEIFSLLVKESGNLPTASARVSERLIAIDAAQDLELAFELVETTGNASATRLDSKGRENMCELIYRVLHVLLLRRHSLINAEKGNDSAKAAEAPSILQPIIDILQYRVFCERVGVELRRAVHALNAVGIPSTLSFTAVGEPGQLLVSLLSERGKKVVGGEAVIRIDNWNTLWFTFISPSTLTAHLSQATLTISSLPQLSQLLMDEIERCLLQRICGLGRELCDTVGGIWFIDLNRCVARWEGCVL
ncbi:subunit 17 of mediator complex-domain-containing protein [Flammula alnicola]|nr:subunit 17 of mediator complex-domain-containing protein [Flammula alnicola]